MNKDKYWTGKDVAEQLRAKIPTFKRLHPGHKLLYAFDNSYTHDCWPDDALDASILNLNPPPAVAPGPSHPLARKRRPLRLLMALRLPPFHPLARKRRPLLLGPAPVPAS